MCAACRLGIGYHAHGVFVLQVHVHHVFRVLVLNALYGRVERLPLEHLQFLHGEVRQILQQHLLVALEECTGVKRQFVYLPSVDEDFARVRHPCAGQLLYQVLQHRPFWQLECRGIIDQRVAAHLHLDARGLHHHLIQPHGLHDGLLHVHHRHREHLFFVAFGHAHPCPAVVIAVFLHTDDVVRGLSRHVDVKDGGDVHFVVTNLIDFRLALHRRTVGPHQRDREIEQAALQERVLYAALQRHFLLCPCRHGDEGEDDCEDVSFHFFLGFLFQ